MPEAPITTNALILDRLSGHVFRARLKNDKEIIVHTPKRLQNLAEELSAGDFVKLEMTPFDFEKGRIEERADGFN